MAQFARYAQREMSIQTARQKANHLSLSQSLDSLSSLNSLGKICQILARES